MRKLILLGLLFSVSQILQAQQTYTTGMLLSKEKYEVVGQLAPLTTRSFTGIPSNYSLKDYCPTPLSQGRQPSCVGWASGFGARTISYAIKNGWKGETSLIDQNIFSPAFVYNIIKSKDDVKCENGAYVSDAMELIRQYGILKYNDFPYADDNCETQPSDYGIQLAADNKIATFLRLADWDNPVNLALNVKKAIANNNPVVIGMSVSSSFYSVSDVWSGVQEGAEGGHAMVVIGYDDNKAGGAFELLNSWGTNWGNSGFIWVRYADFEKYAKTAYVMVENIKDPEPKPQPIVDPKVEPKPQNETVTLQGALSLQLSNGTLMPVNANADISRNFNIVTAEKTTYSVPEAYPTGTQFRIRFKSEKPAYIYLIGYGGGDKSINLLYPFEKYSAYFGFNNSEVAIPNEDYFIEFDNVPGQDILCILFSTKEIDINAVIQSIKNEKGSFVSKVKTYFKSDLFDAKEVKFNVNDVNFSATSANQSSNLVPIFISINHK